MRGPIHVQLENPRTLIFLVAILVGCSSDDGDVGAGTGAATGDTGGCTQGTEACACIEGGLCVAGLVCASDVCVDLGTLDEGGQDESDEGGPKPDDGGDGESDSGGGPVGSCAGNCGGSDMDGDGWCYCVPQCSFSGDCCSDYETECSQGDCTSNEDCADDAVCSSSSATCVPAFGHTYDVIVTRWEDHTPNCWDAGDCYADVQFRMLYEGETVCESTTQNDSQTASWPDEPCTVEFDEIGVWTLAFYDIDDVFDDLTNYVCFPDGDGACAADGLGAVLHAGGATWGSASDDFTVGVIFAAQ